MPDYDDATLKRLLDLQAEDTAILRLNERKANLPEAAKLAELRGQLDELESDLGIATKRFDEIVREQTRFEDEMASIDAKIKREEERMYSGKVANPKELSSLQAEVESLKRRRAGVEDQLLEAMVERESAESTRDNLQQEANTLNGEVVRLEQSVATITSEIDVELAGHKVDRDNIAPEIPETLLKQYDKLREQKHGIGAAELQGGTCSGCHTKLPNVEVERLRAERGLQRCENCRRILVVT